MFLIDSIILVTGVLLLLGIGSSKLSAHLGVPVLVLFLLVGMIAGSEGIGGIEFENYVLAHGIGTVALALILFDGGMSTPLSVVRDAWKPSVWLATVGVLVTAVITGLAAAWILKLTWLEGLLLGSIVGSTDAAAVFAVLRSGGVALPQKISSTLEIESGSNDPMAIFLTVGCIELLAGRMTFGPELLVLFFSQMVLGAGMGVAMGLLSVWIVNRIVLQTTGLYPVLVTSLGLLTFGVTAQLGGSGFLAIYLAGMVLGNQKLSFQRNILLYHDALAWLSQIVMFVVLGLLSFPSRLVEVGGKALLIVAVLILLARPIAVIPLLLPFRFRWNEMAFISWVGLKGAVPITLATFPLLLGTPQAGLLFDVVFFIVVVSAVVQGSTLPWAARKLGLQLPAKPAPPVTLELSSLHHVDGDIVDYSVGPDSRAAGRMVKDLALPEGVVIALIARGSRIIPPQGRTEIHPGDHVILVLQPGTRPLVNRVFGSISELNEIPATMEFPLRGTTTVGELQALYGIHIDAADDCRLEDVISEQLGPDDVQPGRSVQFGPLKLRIRSLHTDGTVQDVGLSFDLQDGAKSGS